MTNNSGEGGGSWFLCQLTAWAFAPGPASSAGAGEIHLGLHLHLLRGALRSHLALPPQAQGNLREASGNRRAAKALCVPPRRAASFGSLITLPWSLQL